MKIDRVEVRVVGPKVERYTWPHDLPAQYMTNTLVRVARELVNLGFEWFEAPLFDYDWRAIGGLQEPPQSRFCLLGTGFKISTASNTR